MRQLYFKTKPSIRIVEGEEAIKVGQYLKVNGQKKDIIQEATVKNAKKVLLPIKAELLSDPPKIKLNVSISKNKNTNSSKDVTLRDALNGYPQNLCSSELSKRKYVTNKDRTILNDSTIDRSKNKIKDPNGIVQTLSMIPTIREKPQGRLLTNNLPSTFNKFK